MVRESVHLPEVQTTESDSEVMSPTEWSDLSMFATVTSHCIHSGGDRRHLLGQWLTPSDAVVSFLWFWHRLQN